MTTIMKQVLTETKINVMRNVQSTNGEQLRHRMTLMRVFSLQIIERRNF